MWWPSPLAGHPTAPIIRDATHLANWYYIGLVIIVGGFWLAAYVLAIREARLSGRNGIPAIACALNIGWEFNDSFVVDHSSWQRPFNFAWFLLDLLILSQVWRFGRKDYSEMSPSEFRRFFSTIVAIGAVAIPAVEIEINDFYGAYTGLGLNCIMSLMFVRTLRRRQSSAGQSMYIAISKGIGSALGVLMSVSLYPYSLVIPVMGVAVIALDSYYAVALHRQLRHDGIPPWSLSQRVTTAVPAASAPVAVCPEQAVTPVT